MPKDLTGQRFGRLVVIAPAGYRIYSEKTKKTLWRCKCSCGNEHVTPTTCLVSGKTRSCGCKKTERTEAARGKRGFYWKGGRITTEHGYVLVYRPEHPAARSNGYVPEHRLAMEDKLGRHLYPDETVHHMNGVKSDNRPENLELWVGNHASGQRVEDMLVWAQSITTRYAPQEQDLVLL